MSKFSDFFDKWMGKGIDPDKTYGWQCHTAGTMILMDDRSWKNIAEIKKGDKVMSGTHPHTFNIVEEVTRGMLPVNEYRTHLTTLCNTGTHPFLMPDGTFGMLSNHAKPIVFDDIPLYDVYRMTDDELRFIGLYMIDGVPCYDTLHVPTNISVALTKYLMSLHLNTDPRYKASFALDQTAHPVLAEHLRTLPNVRLYGIREWALILEGIFASTAVVYSKGGTTLLKSNSKGLLLTLQEAAIRCGYSKAKIRAAVNEGEPHTLALSKQGVMCKTNVFSVMYASEQTVYNLELDGDHTYVAENYICHNCVDVFRQYCTDLGFGHTGDIGGAAKGIYEKFDQNGENKVFTRIPYTPGGTPKEGDVIVYGNGMYGHVALVVWATSKQVVVLEQDGQLNDKLVADGKPQQPAGIKIRGYTNCLGWLRPKEVV